MKFIPYSEYDLTTRLSAEEAKQRLQEQLDAPKKWRYSTAKSGNYDGDIDRDGFTIFHVTPFNAPQWPDITGRFSTAGDRLMIHCETQIPRWQIYFGACAVGFLAICFIGTMISNWSTSHNLRSSIFLGLFFLVAFSLMYFVITIKIRVAANRSKKFLTRLLEAE